MRAAILLLTSIALGAYAQQPAAKPATAAEDEKVVVEGKPVEPTAPAAALEPDSTTEHTVTAGGQKIAYKAVAGTIAVGYSDAFDAMHAHGCGRVLGLGSVGRIHAGIGQQAAVQPKP